MYIPLTSNLSNVLKRIQCVDYSTIPTLTLGGPKSQVLESVICTRSESRVTGPIPSAVGCSLILVRLLLFLPRSASRQTKEPSNRQEFRHQAVKRVILVDPSKKFDPDLVGVSNIIERNPPQLSTFQKFSKDPLRSRVGLNSSIRGANPSLNSKSRPSSYHRGHNLRRHLRYGVLEGSLVCSSSVFLGGHSGPGL